MDDFKFLFHGKSGVPMKCTQFVADQVTLHATTCCKWEGETMTQLSSTDLSRELSCLRVVSLCYIDLAQSIIITGSNNNNQTSDRTQTCSAIHFTFHLILQYIKKLTIGQTFWLCCGFQYHMVQLCVGVCIELLQCQNMPKQTKTSGGLDSIAKAATQAHRKDKNGCHNSYLKLHVGKYIHFV